MFEDIRWGSDRGGRWADVESKADDLLPASAEPTRASAELGDEGRVEQNQVPIVADELESMYQGCTEDVAKFDPWE
jgi:hypothetical protein